MQGSEFQGTRFGANHERERNQGGSKPSHFKASAHESKKVDWLTRNWPVTRNGELRLKQFRLGDPRSRPSGLISGYPEIGADLKSPDNGIVPSIQLRNRIGEGFPSAHPGAHANQNTGASGPLRWRGHTPCKRRRFCAIHRLQP